MGYKYEPNILLCSLKMKEKVHRWWSKNRNDKIPLDKSLRLIKSLSTLFHCLDKRLFYNRKRQFQNLSESSMFWDFFLQIYGMYSLQPKLYNTNSSNGEYVEMPISFFKYILFIIILFWRVSFIIALYYKLYVLKSSPYSFIHFLLHIYTVFTSVFLGQRFFLKVSFLLH